jgi:ribosomal protein L7/L12
MRKLVNVNISGIIGIARVQQAEEENVTMNINNNVRVIEYDVDDINSVHTPTYYGDELVSSEVEEVNEGYALRSGRYIKVVGKYSSFAKKSDAVSLRTIWQYAYKAAAITTLIKSETPDNTDLDTLIFQEGMTATEETSEFQSQLSIGDARQQKEGANVVVNGTCVEYKAREITNMGGRKIAIRHFRLAEYVYSVELIEVGLKPIAVGTEVAECTGMTVFQARNAVNTLLSEKESTVIAKGLNKEQALNVKDRIAKVGGTVEITKVEGKSIWVKPGLKVAMMVGQDYRVHGVLKRMSVFQPRKVVYNEGNERMVDFTEERYASLQGFLSEEEKNSGEMSFVFLSPARFVKYVPEDITGATGDESELSDEQFVQRVLAGYEHNEVINPNDYLVDPTSGVAVNEEMVPENVRKYGWKDFMVQVTGVRPWNKAELSGMGGGMDDLLTKIVDAEAQIENLLEDSYPGVTALMRKLGGQMTGDDTLVPTFTDQDGVVQYGEEEVVLAVQSMEDFIFAKERKEAVAKATERLEKHWSGHRDRETVMVTGGFMYSVCQLDAGARRALYQIMAQARTETEEMRSALKETKVNNDGNIVKVYDFSTAAEPGKAWFEATVMPIANRAIAQFGNELNVTAVAKSLRDGIINAVSMMMRDEVVPLNSKQYFMAGEAIKSKALKIKFYGGTIVGLLWRNFTAWTMIKRMQDKEETGSGHVDDPTSQDTKEAQLDAEAKFIKGWEPKFPREARSR